MKLKIVLVLAVILIGFSGYKLFYSQSADPQAWAQALLAQADIRINGDRPWDITVHNPKLYQRVLDQGSLGLGEAYMDGWWDAQALDQFFYKLLSADLGERITFNWPLIASYIKAKLMNLQSKARAFQVGQEHYDLGNDLFGAMLDDRMIYSCAYWKEASDLNEAQEAKLDLICRKLQLKPGMTLLDIGCGWGGLAAYAAQHYGATVTGITVSQEQANLSQEKFKDLPVTFIVQDYRDLNQKFDRVVSVGMFEHVGYKNYATFMRVVHNCLKDDGLCLLHTIGSNTTLIAADPWITRYIFPNGMLPSMQQITKATEGLFIIEDWHNFGADYDKTLMAWHERFNDAWPELKSRYDERFYRMWNYYLLSCAGLFRARKAQLWQIMLAKNGVSGGYNSIR